MKETGKPLVNGKYLLEKFPGKGGWTYAAIPEILQDKTSPFGWVKVKGTIDGYEIKNCKLMPMGNGRLFLPLKASVRKHIRKEAGQWVNIVLFADSSTIEIPEELVYCLKDEPLAYDKFIKLKQGDQKAYIDWIYAAKKVDTRVQRISTTIDRVLKGLRLSDKE